MRRWHSGDRLVQRGDSFQEGKWSSKRLSSQDCFSQSSAIPRSQQKKEGKRRRKEHHKAIEDAQNPTNWLRTYPKKKRSNTSRGLDISSHNEQKTPLHTSEVPHPLLLQMLSGCEMLLNQREEQHRNTAAVKREDRLVVGWLAR
ncbi:hypothetical protein Y1Q_0010853 [Alligator mississippiensis]|uniref:Uncharacterized protein n=1 Tax=Alligator mississippiensis TaxID=8496 RepID=A0A151M713_ALLMI|nr:hypothetical protein Y1Q_0010853 [Alligator mississippiensis]